GTAPLGTRAPARLRGPAARRPRAARDAADDLGDTARRLLADPRGRRGARREDPRARHRRARGAAAARPGGPLRGPDRARRRRRTRASPPRMARSGAARDAPRGLRGGRARSPAPLRRAQPASRRARRDRTTARRELALGRRPRRARGDRRRRREALGESLERLAPGARVRSEARPALAPPRRPRSRGSPRHQRLGHGRRHARPLTGPPRDTPYLDGVGSCRSVRCPARTHRNALSTHARRPPPRERASGSGPVGFGVRWPVASLWTIWGSERGFRGENLWTQLNKSWPTCVQLSRRVTPETGGPPFSGPPGPLGPLRRPSWPPGVTPPPPPTALRKPSPCRAGGPPRPSHALNFTQCADSPHLNTCPQRVEVFPCRTPTHRGSSPPRHPEGATRELPGPTHRTH